MKKYRLGIYRVAAKLQARHKGKSGEPDLDFALEGFVVEVVGGLTLFLCFFN